jgi:hypothetical protein
MIFLVLVIFVRVFSGMVLVMAPGVASAWRGSKYETHGEPPESL